LLWWLRPGGGGSGELTAPSEELKIRTFRVSHIAIREGGKSRQRRGVFGEASYGAWVDDGVEVVVEFSEPAYAYLLIFNPNAKAEKREEVEPEELRDQPPSAVPRLELPGDNGHYQLNDGPGLEVFAVVASRQRLPAYAEWVRQRGDVGWQRTEAPKDVVWRGEGNPQQSHVAPYSRTRVRTPPEQPVVKDLLRKLKSAPGVEAVSLVAFTVEPRP
jgi:hypothetical protein